MANKTELAAIATFKILCHRRHWKYRSATKGENCDFVIDGKKIEIKGSKYNNSIPDTYNSEFDKKTLTFKPDWLFVVYVPESGKHKISAIPRKTINEYKHHKKVMVRWNNTLKTNLRKGLYHKIPKTL